MASPQAELSQSSSNRKLVLAGQIAFLPTGILTTLLGPMLPILIARWAMNDTQAGNLFLVQFLASLVGVQLSGFLLARWGFRPAFLLGLLLMACGVATLYMGSRSGSDSKFRVFKVRSQRMNVGFFNRYKPSGTERWNLSPEFREVAPRGN
jgi:fucose permease